MLGESDTELSDTGAELGDSDTGVGDSDTEPGDSGTACQPAAAPALPCLAPAASALVAHHLEQGHLHSDKSCWKAQQPFNYTTVNNFSLFIFLGLTGTFSSRQRTAVIAPCSAAPGQLPLLKEHGQKQRSCPLSQSHCHSMAMLRELDLPFSCHL